MTMITTINSKVLDQYLAFGVTQGGHLYVSVNGAKVRQCCEGGALGGGWTVLTSEETFKRDVKRWYRAYVRRHQEMA